MSNIFEDIIQFNAKAGLLGPEPLPKKEAAYVIEEALEDFDLGILNSLISPSKELSSPKDTARKLMDIVTWSKTPNIPKTKQVDKCVDSVIFSIGHLAKLGLNAKQIQDVFDAVILANNAKLGCPKDELGKLTKPADFDEMYSPEPKIAVILAQAGIKD